MLYGRLANVVLLSTEEITTVFLFRNVFSNNIEYK